MKDQDNTIKTRYSDEELEEFKKLILEKLEKAHRDLKMLTDAYTNNMNMVPMTLLRHSRFLRKDTRFCRKKKTADLLHGNKNSSPRWRMPLSG